MDEKAVKIFVLKKLVRTNMWGSKHLPLLVVRNWIPETYRNTHQGMRIFERSVKDLINEQWIIFYMKKTGKSSDRHISLNPRKSGEIWSFLNR